MSEFTAVQLSEREAEILRLVATGATNQQIADSLDISVNTVKVHMRNIFGKIGASSRTEATLYAMRQGLVSIDRGAAGDVATDLAAESALVQPDEDGLGEAARPADAPPVGDTEPRFELPAPTTSDQVLAPEPSTPTHNAPAAATARRSRPWPLMLVSLLALGLLALVAYLATGRGLPGIQPAGSPAESLPAQPNRWTNLAPLAQPRAHFALASFEGRIYAIGGSNPSGPLDVVERFDPQNNIWVPLSNKPTAVSQVQAVTVGGRIFVPGGELAGGSVATVFEAYDPRSERWETLAPLPAPRSRYALASVEGRVYLFGGWDGSSVRGEVFVYDTASDRWEERTPMPTPRRDAGVAVVENRVYVIGGEDGSSPLRVSERYDPFAEANGQPWDGAVPLPRAIAAPAAVGITNVLIVFDPDRQVALLFQPSTEAWTELALPDNVGVSSRAAALTTEVFVFGPSPSDAALLSPLYQYQAVYTTFLPVPINP
jgi:DNA-binding CsgD family transcriptional regulator